MSEESLKRGPVSGLERLMRSKPDLFGGPFNVRPWVVVAFGAVGWYVVGRSGTDNGNSGLMASYCKSASLWTGLTCG